MDTTMLNKATSWFVEC